MNNETGAVMNNETGAVMNNYVKREDFLKEFRLDADKSFGNVDELYQSIIHRMNEKKLISAQKEHGMSQEFVNGFEAGMCIIAADVFVLMMLMKRGGVNPPGFNS